MKVEDRPPTCPICHGEPMHPVLRYIEGGQIMVRYQCGMHHCSEQVDVMISAQERDKEISDALDRFSFMWKRRGEDP